MRSCSWIRHEKNRVRTSTCGQALQQLSPRRRRSERSRFCRYPKFPGHREEAQPERDSNCPCDRGAAPTDTDISLTRNEIADIAAYIMSLK